MLKNENLSEEIWQIIRDQHWSVPDLANRMEIARPNVYRTVDQKHVSDALVKLMDILGYDVEVKFVRKKKR